MRTSPALTFLFALACAGAAQSFTVDANFESASVRVIQQDEATQTVRFMPGGDPSRGWACWWQFRVAGLDVTKALTLELEASDLPMPQANGSPAAKPLSGDWSMPERASYSTDGKEWHHTEPGRKEGARMIYTIKTGEKSLLLAWGPPYTPLQAAAFVNLIDSRHQAAVAEELCRSREGRSVPMLRISEGDRAPQKRFGVWVHARQHAWEAGSSWVCQGFTEWLMSSSDEDAAWLRQHAEIFIVPIMDIDNTATGNGGKEALPQDHNRDWQEKPNWNEVAAAQRHIRTLTSQGRMDVFLDLHNPAPGDKKVFFYALPAELMKEPMLTHRSRFIELATTSIREVFPMLDKPKETGPTYHPLWRQISGTWVTMHGNPHTVSACLETPWNTPQSTVAGYKSVGAQLAKALRKYLGTLPERG